MAARCAFLHPRAGGDDGKPLFTPALWLTVSLALLLSTHSAPTAAAGENTDTALVQAKIADGFALAVGGRAADIVSDPADAPVVAYAAADLAADIASVSGLRPSVSVTATPSGKHLIIIGTLGKNRFIDQLVAAGKLDAQRLHGAWESFLIATVEQPVAGVDHALIIVGSDRRGAAFGVYELSEAMGVSPWVWWADVRPRHRDALMVAPGVRRFGPPSVRYRGIFINDEDWGLIPWAARTFEPANKNIGPKTYTEVFRLLLRLKANTLWPAMHKCTVPFNSDPRNARLADEYAIVMGSSHAEPMLRNNVGEWKDDPKAFNYATNVDGVRHYWEERVRTNARYESLWTLGMRGIHDSGMVGAAGAAEKVAMLERVIADQRAMLSRHVGAELSRVPQVFVPYKEVLELYQQGLKVPDDVTLVWPDDNFGYIRQFTSDAERARRGGGGVYYHLSYLGAPLAYLWLGTTPPALVQQEMTRAYDFGARQLWIANVGDIKPAEIDISLFLEMAWDIERWRGRTQRAFLEDWARRTFGPNQARALGAVLDEHFRLSFERRPEHLQWWLPGERPRASPLPAADVDARLHRFEQLVQAVQKLRATVAPENSDAYFELVEYPILAAAAANRRFFGAQRFAALIDDHPEAARDAARMSRDADEQVNALTARFNDDIAGGKWRHLMNEEPADNQWPTFRISRLSLPAPSLAGPRRTSAALSPSTASPARGGLVEAEAFTANRGWRLVESLGRGSGSMFADGDGSRLTIRLEVGAGEARPLELALLPLFPSRGEGGLLLDVVIDRQAPRPLKIERQVQTKPWAQGVLDNLLWIVAAETLEPGTHEITVIARGSGIALDQLGFRPAN